MGAFIIIQQERFPLGMWIKKLSEEHDIHKLGMSFCHVNSIWDDLKETRLVLIFRRLKAQL